MEDGLRKEWFECLLGNLLKSEEDAQTDDEKLLMQIIVEAIREHTTFYDDAGNEHHI